MEVMFRHPVSSPRPARRWTIGALAALVMTVGAILIPALPAHSATGGATIHALVNEARAANGQAGLLRNAALDEVAAAWAEQMAAAGAISHNPSYSAQIPGGWVRAGENVAQGQASEAAMHNAWMGSAGHRANVLGDFTDIGIAFLSADGTTWGVEVFAAYPGHGAPEPAAPPAPQPEPATAEPAPTAEAAPAATTTKGRTASTAAPPTEEVAPGAEPTPSASATAAPRSPSTYRSSASRGSADAVAEGGTPASADLWLWIGIPSVTLLAVAAGGVVLLRGRGLIGPPSGRHTVGG